MRMFVFAMLSTTLFCNLDFAKASPHPATGTSPLASSKWGLYNSELGFQLDARGTKWNIEEAPSDSDSIRVLFRQPGAHLDTELLLSVRTDEAKKTPDRAAYMKRWTALYQRLGFQIGQTQDANLGENTATIVDLLHKESGKQLRQFVFFQKPNVVILTCSDHRERFIKRHEECTKLAASLKWVAVPQTTSKKIQ